MTNQILAGHQDSNITATQKIKRPFGVFFFEDCSMLKRFFLSLALAAGLLSPSYGAGTIPLSLSQRFDNITHVPLAAGQLFFIQAGTTSTPQNAFQDSALTLPYPNPITLDSGGNIPQLFFADGQIKIRLTNSAGVNQLTVDNILVVGPSSGGGGGGTVDPTTILTTGDIKATYGTGVIVGFVRANGRTIGSASSGASERANADVQALFQYLWATDPNLVVSTGRGVSANADWVANKQITLPDWRGRTLAGLDDMGNSAAGRLTATYFGGTSINSCVATTLGCAAGSESQTLNIAQLPPIASTGNNTISVSAHSGGSNIPVNNSAITQVFVTIAGSGTIGPVSGGSWGSVTALSDTNNIGVTSNNTTSTPHPIVSPLMLTTIYLKL